MQPAQHAARLAPSRTGEDQPALRPGTSQDPDRGALPPAQERGRTYIEDDVVSIIARLAAENVEGVHALGESKLRAIVSRLGRHHGVEAEVGMKEAAVDVEVVIDFGYPIREVARELRRHIIHTVEAMTARQVVEVNVYVIDVHVEKNEPRHRRQLE